MLIYFTIIYAALNAAVYAAAIAAVLAVAAKWKLT